MRVVSISTFLLIAIAASYTVDAQRPPQGNGMGRPTTLAAAPVPTTTRAACPSAPIVTSNDQSSTAAAVVSLTVKPRGKETRAWLLQTVAELLCLPSAALSILATADAASGAKRIYVSIACASGVCNNAERQAALVTNYAKIQDVSAASAGDEGLAVADATDNDDGKGGPSRDRATVIGVAVAACVVILALIAIIAVLIARNRRRQAELEEAKRAADDAVDATVVRVQPYGNDGNDDGVCVGRLVQDDEEDSTEMVDVVACKTAAPMPPQRSEPSASYYADQERVLPSQPNCSEEQ